MSNDVATGDFWGGMDKSDFAIPMVSIGQPTSEGEAGHFNFNNGKSVPMMEKCKLLVPNKTRVLYQSNSKKARCSSDNFYEPSRRVAEPICGNCMTCYAAEWGELPEKEELAKEIGKQGSLNPPLCKETYNLLMLDIDNAPFFIKFQGTQLKIVSQKLFSRLQYEFGQYQPYQVGFDMALELVQKPGVKYYSVVFNDFYHVEEGADKIAAIYSSHRQQAQGLLASQHAAMDAEHDEQPPF
jgi:hypothetical protein